MRNVVEKLQSRRELFTAILRYAALGAIGSLGGASLVKRRRLIKQGKCINRGICRGCEVFDDCLLPQALSAKQVLAGASNAEK